MRRLITVGFHVEPNKYSIIFQSPWKHQSHSILQAKKSARWLRMFGDTLPSSCAFSKVSESGNKLLYKRMKSRHKTKKIFQESENVHIKCLPSLRWGLINVNWNCTIGILLVTIGWNDGMRKINKKWLIVTTSICHYLKCFLWKGKWETMEGLEENIRPREITYFKNTLRNIWRCKKSAV